MCGHYTQTAPADALRELFQIEEEDEGLEVRPRYDVAPTQMVLAVRAAP